MNALELSAPSISEPESQASRAPGLDPDVVPEQTSPPPFSVVESALRLVVGSTLIGGEELARRLQVWEQETMAEDRAVTGRAASDQDRVRYALIGFLFLAQQRAGQQLNHAVNQYQRHNPGRGLSRLRDRVAGVPLLRPLVSPLRSRGYALSRRWGDDVERWIRIGRIGERDSRSLANKATGELVDEVIAYLAENPAVTNLVQQQGVGVAGDVLDTVRQTTATADDVVEGLIWHLLRRAPRASRSVRGAPTSHVVSEDGPTHE